MPQGWAWCADCYCCIYPLAWPGAEAALERFKVGIDDRDGAYEESVLVDPLMQILEMQLFISRSLALRECQVHPAYNRGIHLGRFQTCTSPGWPLYRISSIIRITEPGARVSNEDIVQESEHIVVSPENTIYKLLEHLRYVSEPKRHACKFEKPKWREYRGLRYVCLMNWYLMISSY